MAGSLSAHQLKPILEWAQQRIGSRPKVFVETGTLNGDTALSVAPLFEQVRTIEVDRGLQKHAAKRCSIYPAITVHRGDSGQILGEIISPIREPICFYLDAHYSGGVTGRSHINDVPLYRELYHVAQHDYPDIIIIDDLDYFGTKANPHDSASDWSRITVPGVLKALSGLKVLRTAVLDKRFVLWMGL